MIPSKDAKELLYKLFAERLGLVHLSFQPSSNRFCRVLGIVQPTQMSVFSIQSVIRKVIR